MIVQVTFDKGTIEVPFNKWSMPSSALLNGQWHELEGCSLYPRIILAIKCEIKQFMKKITSLLQHNNSDRQSGTLPQSLGQTSEHTRRSNLGNTGHRSPREIMGSVFTIQDIFPLSWCSTRLPSPRTSFHAKELWRPNIVTQAQMPSWTLGIIQLLY